MGLPTDITGNVMRGTSNEQKNIVLIETEVEIIKQSGINGWKLEQIRQNAGRGKSGN